MTCCVHLYIYIHCFWICFDLQNDLHPIPISKIAPGRNWRTAWWSLTPPDPSPSDRSLWSLGLRGSEVQRWSPVLQRDEAFLIHIQLRKERSNLAWNSVVDFSRNSSQLQGISWHFQRPRNAFPKCGLLRQWILHGSRTHLSARVRPGKLGVVVFWSSHWVLQSEMVYPLEISELAENGPLMPWFHDGEFWFSSSQTLKLPEGMVVSYGQIWFSTKSLPRASQLSRLKWELTNCGPQCSAEKSLCIVNILINCHTSEMAFKNTEQTTSGEYPPQQTVCPLTLVCQFLTCSTNGHMTPVEFA